MSSQTWPGSQVQRVHDFSVPVSVSVCLCLCLSVCVCVCLSVCLSVFVSRSRSTPTHYVTRTTIFNSESALFRDKLGRPTWNKSRKQQQRQRYPRFLSFSHIPC